MHSEIPTIENWNLDKKNIVGDCFVLKKKDYLWIEKSEWKPNWRALGGGGLEYAKSSKQIGKSRAIS